MSQHKERRALLLTLQVGEHLDAAEGEAAYPQQGEVVALRLEVAMGDILDEEEHEDECGCGYARNL